jgi:DNA-binding transcriptional ArsR family regulator
MARPNGKRRASSKVTGICDAAGAVTASAGKPPLRKRPLITAEQAEEVVGLFQVLANATRLRLLHALERGRELSVTKLAHAIGMRPQGVSNQLQRLRDRGILTSRREGNRIFYRVADPCVPSLLDLGICLSEETR